MSDVLPEYTDENLTDEANVLSENGRPTGNRLSTDPREVLSAQIADEGRCVCVGGVGHTALFYRQNPDPTARTVVLP